MGTRILVADPNDEWLKKVKIYLENFDYSIVSANDGKRAQLSLYQQDRGKNNAFWAMILNLALKHHPGGQVYAYVRKNFPLIKLIIIADCEDDFTEAGIDRKTFEKHNIHDIFVKPFELTVLKDAIESYQSINQAMHHTTKNKGQSDEVEVKLLDDEFSSIPIIDFVPMKSMQFDIFVKLDSGKYIKILHSGDDFSKDRIDKYKNDKKVTHLYFLAKDRKKYIQYNNFIADKVIKNSKVNISTKINLVKNTGEKIVEEMFSEGIRPTTFEQGKGLCNNIYELVNSEKELGKHIKNLSEFDPAIYTHSYLVCLFSSMLMKQFDWESKVVNESVGMAALLHDIGMLKLDKSLIKIPPSKMSPEQLYEYKKHPEYGVEMLGSNPLISSIVKQIVLQHHESFDGTGYPHRLKGSKTLTFSKLIFMVDEFVDNMIENNLRPTDALKTLLRRPDSVQRYSSQMLEHFIRVFIDSEKLKLK